MSHDQVGGPQAAPSRDPASAAPAPSPRRTSRGTPLRVFVRTASYVTCGVVAYVLLAGALPPLLSDSTRRAVVDVPLTLVTAPIAGEVTSLDARPSDRIATGQGVARIENNRVDRSTLIGLDSQRVALRVALQTFERQLALIDNQLARVVADLEVQRAFLVAQARAFEEEARGQVASAEAVLEERTQVERRLNTLAAQGVVAANPVTISGRQTLAAQGDLQARRAVLARRRAQREVLEAGQFAGDNLGPAAELALRQRDLERERLRVGLDAQDAREKLVALEAAVGLEKARLSKLEAAEVVAPIDGAVFKVHVNAGRHIAPGETVLSAVDCRKTFVAAIFSIRQASALPVGTPVSISGDGWTGPRRGTVAQVMPRTNDQVDQTYAVPFPPIERREMYVLIEPDWASGNEAPPPGKAEVPCGAGQWVSVATEGEDGLIERATRIAERSVQAVAGAARQLLDGVLGAPPVAAHTRDPG